MTIYIQNYWFNTLLILQFGYLVFKLEEFNILLIQSMLSNSSCLKSHLIKGSIYLFVINVFVKSSKRSLLKSNYNTYFAALSDIFMP